MSVLLSIFGVATIFALGYAFGHGRGRAAEKRRGPRIAKGMGLSVEGVQLERGPNGEQVQKTTLRAVSRPFVRRDKV